MAIDQQQAWAASHVSDAIDDGETSLGWTGHETQRGAFLFASQALQCLLANHFVYTLANKEACFLE
jgi:hypothetical protein